MLQGGMLPGDQLVKQGGKQTFVKVSKECREAREGWGGGGADWEASVKETATYCAQPPTVPHWD